jgi:hypothetical protein
VFDARTEVSLASGERVTLSSQGRSVVRKATASEGMDSWVSENLKRDAVHQHEIALLQQQRRAHGAGILPNSTLYPVKRVAEAVDMLLTFGAQARAEKLLDQANTRLNEAAALLATGSGTQAAQGPLQEYRQTVLSISTGSGATGSGQESAIRTLVAERVASEAADVSAALPGDQSYLLKQTVLETSAALPQSTIKPEDVKVAILVDHLIMLTQRAESGDASGAVAGLQMLAPSLSLTDGTTAISSESRKEAKAMLSLFALTLKEKTQSTGSGIVLSDALGKYLPGFGPTVSAMLPLTDTEVDALVQRMYRRIFLYSEPRSREDQLIAEFHTIDNSPDRGRILRRLYHVLPPNGLAIRVRAEIQKVREDVLKNTL